MIMSSKHYIVPTSGASIRGLIQDHIAAATLLSGKVSFIGRTKVVFRKGELTHGVIDKSSLGSSMYGIVHGVQETYGNSCVRQGMGEWHKRYGIFDKALVCHTQDQHDTLTSPPTRCTGE